MDNRSEVCEFLQTRRARVTPDQVGIPTTGTRRVPGLRRGEVAALAGVSVEYYSRLERGAIAGASPSVLEALARALRLDEAERAHLLDLARAAEGSGRRRRTPRRWQPSPTLQWLLDGMTESAAFVANGRTDLLASNALGRALHDEVYAGAAVRGQVPNFARFIFLDEASERFYPGWDLAASTNVAMLRTHAGQEPHDRELHDLIGELSTRSEDFRTRWAAHNVRIHSSGTKRFTPHVVGDLDLTYEVKDLRSDPGLSVTAYTAEPASTSAERLRLLASWAATDTTAPTH
ncbi:helix-turn-helix transcriptional regulator [Actinomycetota bacterium]